MTTFVLVHGAFHGAWCWTKVVPALARRGHRALALDMPGSGEDCTPLPKVTLDSYAARIGEALAAEKEPVVLVGHSLGSMAVALATERWPERVKRLVYLAGFAPRDGQSLFTSLEAMDNPASTVTTPPTDHPWTGLSEYPDLKIARKRFYNECAEEDIAFALPLLRPQANAPRVTPVRLSRERYERVPRIFIGCSKDRAMSDARRQKMIDDGGCERCIELPTDHSPFLAMPDRLADEFVKLA